jgi:hypothetical protein
MDPPARYRVGDLPEPVKGVATKLKFMPATLASPAILQVFN